VFIAQLYVMRRISSRKLESWGYQAVKECRRYV